MVGVAMTLSRSNYDSLKRALVGVWGKIFFYRSCLEICIEFKNAKKLKFWKEDGKSFYSLLIFLLFIYLESIREIKMFWTYVGVKKLIGTQYLH